MEQRFDYKNNDLDRITYCHTRVPQCGGKGIQYTCTEGKLCPIIATPHWGPLQRGAVWLHKDPQQEQPRFKRWCSQCLRLGLSPSECVFPVNYQLKSHCITCGAQHLPPLSQVFITARKKLTPQILKFTHMGWWWLKPYCCFKTLSILLYFLYCCFKTLSIPLFPSVLLLPCCQYENIAGTDSHCISSCFLLDPPQCGCSGPSVSVELLSSRPLKTFLVRIWVLSQWASGHHGYLQTSLDFWFELMTSSHIPIPLSSSFWGFLFFIFQCCCFWFSLHLPSLGSVKSCYDLNICASLKSIMLETQCNK